MPRVPEVYDYICPFSELIDKLINEDIKCSRANHIAIDERKKENPDPEVIAACEKVARTAGEHRVRLRGEIDQRFNEAIRRGGINVMEEARTYFMKGS